GDHQGNVEVVEPLTRHREADQATAMCRHEVDRVRGDFIGSDHEIAFVFAVFVVHDDDELSILNVDQCFFNRCKFHAVSRCSMRSTYLAITSYSIFTVSPDLACRKFVFSNVCGMIATSTTEERSAATVRLTPSMAIEPF